MTYHALFTQARSLNTDTLVALQAAIQSGESACAARLADLATMSGMLAERYELLAHSEQMRTVVGFHNEIPA